MRSAALGLAGIAVLAIVVAYAIRTKPTPPPTPVVDTPANCETIRVRYHEALAPLQSCTRDDECVAERRDGIRSGLDGCARFYRRDANLAATVDPLVEAWLMRGCSGTFLSCNEERAQCKAGRCVELPPDPVPPTWRRITHGTVFSFFIPPDAVDQEVIGEDSEVGEWRTPNYRVTFDYGYGTNIVGDAEEGDRVIHREPFAVEGTTGELITTRMHRGDILSGVFLPALHNTIGHRTALTLWATCKSEVDCRDGLIIARSLELH